MHVVSAVERSGERTTDRADRHEALPAVPGLGHARVDIVGEDEILVEQIAGRRADALQAVNVGDLVGRRRGAVAALGAQERAAREAEILRREARQIFADLAPVAVLQREGADIDRAGRADVAAGIERECCDLDGAGDGDVVTRNEGQRAVPGADRRLDIDVIGGGERQRRRALPRQRVGDRDVAAVIAVVGDHHILVGELLLERRRRDVGIAVAVMAIAVAIPVVAVVVVAVAVPVVAVVVVAVAVPVVAIPVVAVAVPVVAVLVVAVAVPVVAVPAVAVIAIAVVVFR